MTSGLKMLPSACGLWQHFQDLGHSFSLYGPPSRQITYKSAIFFKLRACKPNVKFEIKNRENSLFFFFLQIVCPVFFSVRPIPDLYRGWWALFPPKTDSVFILLAMGTWGLVSRFHCCSVCPSQRRHLEFLIRLLIG